MHRNDRISLLPRLVYEEGVEQEVRGGVESKGGEGPRRQKMSCGCWVQGVAGRGTGEMLVVITGWAFRTLLSWGLPSPCRGAVPLPLAGHMQSKPRFWKPPPLALLRFCPHIHSNLLDGCHAHGLIVVQGCIWCAHVVAEACNCHLITAMQCHGHCHTAKGRDILEEGREEACKV